MTPLEAAKTLARGSGDPCGFCLGYEGSPFGLHADDCPMLAMPMIVAALEAAEFLVEHGIVASYFTGPYGEYNAYICGACEGVDNHHQPDCRGEALKRALRGKTA